MAEEAMDDDRLAAAQAKANWAHMLGTSMMAVVTDLMIELAQRHPGDSEEGLKLARTIVDRSIAGLQVTGNPEAERADLGPAARKQLLNLADRCEAFAREKLDLPPKPSPRH